MLQGKEGGGVQVDYVGVNLKNHGGGRKKKKKNLRTKGKTRGQKVTFWGGEWLRTGKRKDVVKDR